MTACPHFRFRHAGNNVRWLSSWDICCLTLCSCYQQHSCRLAGHGQLLCHRLIELASYDESTFELALVYMHLVSVRYCGTSLLVFLPFLPQNRNWCEWKWQNKNLQKKVEAILTLIVAHHDATSVGCQFSGSVIWFYCKWPEAWSALGEMLSCFRSLSSFKAW